MISNFLNDTVDMLQFMEFNLSILHDFLQVIFLRICAGRGTEGRKKRTNRMCNEDFERMFRFVRILLEIRLHYVSSKIPNPSKRAKKSPYHQIRGFFVVPPAGIEPAHYF